MGKPQAGEHPAQRRTADGAPLPSKLRLAFSQAADIARVGRMFDPAVKDSIDPKRFVVRREKSVFESTIASGKAAFLYDTANGEVHTLTMAYPIRDKQSGNHDHTEIGTSITRLAGFKSAQIVIAAMILKEWWEDPPSGMIVTEILPDNAPSLHVYRDQLGWTPVTDTETVETLHRLCNESISAEDKGRQTVWFCCGNAVLPKLAQILIDHMDKGALHNKYSGETIDLDLQAMDDIGLTRRHLELIARGITDKGMLRAMPAPPPPPAP